MIKATQVKSQWEKHFQEKSKKYLDAKLCLCVAEQCSACRSSNNDDSNNNILKASKWHFIQESTLSGQAVMLSNRAVVGGKLRQVCDHFLKSRMKGAPAPPNDK